MASRNGSDTRGHEVALVSDRLLTSLTRFAGADGFASLMRRALVLASDEVPALRHVTVGPDGGLEGLDRLTAATVAAADNAATHAATDAAARDALATEAAIAITSQLLALLVTFIGRPITLRLVREAWPDAPIDEDFPRNEADS